MTFTTGSRRNDMPRGRRSCGKPSRRCRSGSSGEFPSRPPYRPRPGSTSPRPETDQAMSCTLNSDRECLKVVDTFRKRRIGRRIGDVRHSRLSNRVVRRDLVIVGRRGVEAGALVARSPWAQHGHEGRKSTCSLTS